MLHQVKLELHHSEPFPAHLRQQWSDAAKSDNQVEPVQSPASRSSRSWYLAAALAASLLLVLIPLAKWWANDAPPIAENGSNAGGDNHQQQIAVTMQHDRISVGQISVSTLDGREQLDELYSKVAVLQDQLAQLVDRSEQLAIQQQLSQLLASHERWQATGM